MSAQNLPNREQAWVQEIKIVGYLLKSDHPEGGPKAKFFQSRGFTSAEWESFADALRHHAKHNPISRIKSTPFATESSVSAMLHE